jgi:hypothetical protein
MNEKEKINPDKPAYVIEMPENQFISILLSTKQTRLKRDNILLSGHPAYNPGWL